MSREDPNLVDALLFEIADRRGALLIEDVDEVLRALAITPLVKAPTIIEGIINVRGTILPVVNLRSRFGLPRRGVALSDRFIVMKAGARKVALRVDAVDGVIRIAASEIEDAARTGPAHERLNGVAKLGDELILIFDAASFLSATDEAELDRALAHRSEA